MTKVCNKCKIEKKLEEFSKSKKYKDGLFFRCKNCQNIYHREWSKKNPDKIKENSKRYLINNPEKRKQTIKESYEKHKESKLQYTKDWSKTNKNKRNEYSKRWKHKNIEKVKSYSKAWNANNKDCRAAYIKKNSEKIRIYRNNWKKNQYTTNTLYKLETNIRNTIGKTLRTKNFTKKSKTYEILGCTYEQALKHLEQTFLINYSRLPNENDKLHIDHIIPISSAKTEAEVIKLNHISNLQWLLEKDNLEKGAKVIPELAKIVEIRRQEFEEELKKIA